MKTKDQLYKEAVERSQKHAKKWANALVKEGVAPIDRLKTLKHKLGVRVSDSNMDSTLNDLLNKANKE